MKKIISCWKRVVIKVGSALIAPEGKGCSTKYLLGLANYIHHLHEQNVQVILVSSGSVAAGVGVANYPLIKKLSVREKQALAAIGQSQVMQHWQKLFDRCCAQLLLTRSDLESEVRRKNAQNTLESIYAMGAIAIINENDSVVVDELVVGDNDNLAAQVSVLANADALIICSDVEGLFDKNPDACVDANLIKSVKTVDSSIFEYACGTENPIATGGMQTKLQAAKLATEFGIDTLIVNGKVAQTFELLKVAVNPGTWFYACKTKEKAYNAEMIEDG